LQEDVEDVNNFLIYGIHFNSSITGWM